jgi:hypothetical protein
VRVQSPPIGSSHAEARFLLKDNDAWYASSAYLRRLHRATGARILYGHDLEVIESYMQEKEYFE